MKFFSSASLLVLSQILLVVQAQYGRNFEDLSARDYEYENLLSREIQDVLSSLSTRELVEELEARLVAREPGRIGDAVRALTAHREAVPQGGQTMQRREPGRLGDAVRALTAHREAAPQGDQTMQRREPGRVGDAVRAFMGHRQAVPHAGGGGGGGGHAAMDPSAGMSDPSMAGGM